MNGQHPNEPEITVFYAWQVDRDKKTNRHLIQAAAQKALNRIRKDPSFGVRLKLDHDTKGVPGTPAITDTILQKIEKATIFLADVTYVAETEPAEAIGKKKSVPNPNVLFELGYAFKVMGPERIICVMNDAYGKAEQQIFDLAHRRWPLSYELHPDDQSKRTEERTSLSKKIEKAIKDILDSDFVVSQMVNRKRIQEQRLQDWEDYSKNRWKQLITEQLADARPTMYNRGFWTAAYSIIGDFPPPDAKEFKNILKGVEREGTNRPVWDTGSEREKSPLYFYDDCIECWIDDGGYSDFWIASPDGSMFLVRPYREDFESQLTEPGKVLWVDSIIIQVAECLLHAQRLAQTLAKEPYSILCSFRWQGLSNRVMQPSVSLRGKPNLFWADRICRQSSAQSPIRTVTIKQIDENIHQVIEDLTRQLFLAFQLPDPPRERIAKSVANLKRSLT